MRFTTLKWGILVAIFRLTVSGRQGTRIVKGTSTTIEQHPYMVQIMMTEGKHRCGGFIITAYWILTAAHCTKDYAPNRPIKFKLFVGSTYSGQGAKHDVDTVVVHDLYDPKDNNYADIAMMKAGTNFEFSDKVALIDVPTNEWTYGDCKTAGWGMTNASSHREPAKVLQEVELQTISLGECRKVFTPFDSNICVLALREGAAPCFGDSGGPLVCDGAAAGLLSYGSENCDRQQPEVYTSVAAYYSWIRNVLHKDDERR